MKITVETVVKSDLNRVWHAWNNPEDWHTPQATVDLRVPRELVAYRMSDGRECTVEFKPNGAGVRVRETFDAETENPAELQRQGWQAILDNFARHVEGGAP